MNFSSNGTATRLACYMMGDKVEVPLVLLHGFCADSSVWACVREELTHTGQIFVDLPGFGESGMPHSANMRAYAEMLFAELDRQGIGRCVLVGHSMGGYVALEFAAHWPERLAGLGLVSSHPYADTIEKKEVRLRGIEALRAGKRDLYVSQFVPNLFAPEHLLANWPLVEELIDIGQQISPLALEMALQTMLERQDRQKELASLPCPALFLLGKSDTIVPLEQAMPAVLLPDVAELHLLPETGHMAMLERPEETAEILSDFWKRCTP